MFDWFGEWILSILHYEDNILEEPKWTNLWIGAGSNSSSRSI
jgi:hypothetical protein